MDKEPVNALDLIKKLVDELIPVTNELDFGRVFKERVGPHIEDNEIYPLIEELAMINEGLYKNTRYHNWVELAGLMLYRHGKQQSLDFLEQAVHVPFLRDLQKPLASPK